MSRHVRALLSVFAAAVGVIGDASCASAGAPDQQGWWTLTNVGLASQTGLAVPAPPAPAGVPANGLLIEGGSGPDSPIAYAAVVYSVPVAASARSLTLTVATGSVSAPASTLRICRLVNPILIAEQGGPMGDAPAYDCSHSATAGPSADGTSYRFEVAPLVTDGNLAVAILPTTATDRVVFDQPDSKSLMVTAGPTPSNPAESTPDAVTDVGAPAEGASSLAGSDLLPADANPAAIATTQPGVVGLARQPLVTIGSRASRNRSAIPTVLALIASAAAGVLWAAAGRARPQSWSGIWRAKRLAPPPDNAIGS
jgi:hypothetical protein